MMVSLLLAVIGLPVGLVLDALVGRLAVTPLGGEQASDSEPEAPQQRPAAHGAETGSLVVSGRLEPAWLRRSFIVAATSGLFAIAAARYDDSSHLAVVTAYICVLLLCAATDALTFRVPNVVTYPAIVGALVVGAVLPDGDLTEAIGGGLLAGGILLIPALFTGGVGMGMGDVKLATFAGLALGFVNVVPALLFMALGGGAVTVLLLVTRTRRWGQPIPYTPFIAAGALAVLLWQGTVFVELT